MQDGQFRSSYNATEVAQSRDPQEEWKLQSVLEKATECLGGVGGWGPRGEAQHVAKWGPSGRDCSENFGGAGPTVPDR